MGREGMELNGRRGEGRVIDSVRISYCSRGECLMTNT